MAAKRNTILLLFLGMLGWALGCTPMPIPYDPPDKTTWTPEGCRPVASGDPALALPPEFFRGLHADTLNSDEVSITLAPVLEFEWVAETAFYIAEGPTFDADGNIYFSPISPGEPVILVSLEPDTGARRWDIPGSSLYGGGAPLVLDDPANPGNQIIYVGLYDRAAAVQPDGTVLWDVPTGLPAPPPPGDNLTDYHCFGLNYDPNTDALVGVMGDGKVTVLDRATGAQLLAASYEVPGEPSPPSEPSALPKAVIEKANEALRPLLGALPSEVMPLGVITDVLLGFDNKVANYLAIDPHTGRMFVAATAPDAEDGTVDGISELGALYCLEMVIAEGPPYTIQEVYHASFVGGSGTSPALNAAGTRVYMGDNLGNLIAIDSSNGNKIWELDTGAQIFGSVGVSSDNSELYASNREGIFKVRDNGTYGEEVWRAQLDGYTPGLGQENLNLNLAGIGASGVFVHVGAGYVISDFPMPLKVGMGLLDRETGETRYFADGLEETVSAMSTGPDGAVYLGHSPLRRAVAWALFGDLGLTYPIVGGVGKYAARRLDLLIRDAVCAGSARALNAHNSAGTCPDSVEVDIRQIQGLIDQCRRSFAKAIAEADLTASEWATLDRYLTDAEASLSVTTLDVAAGHLQQACDFFPN